MKYLLLLISFIGVIQISAQVDDYQKKLDSLQYVVIENQGNDTVITSAYLLATELLFNHDQDSLFALCHVILDKTKEAIHSTTDKKTLHKLNEIRSGAFNNIGVYYFFKGDIETTVDFFTKSYELDKANGNIENAAETINNIGFVYQEYGDIDLSIKYFEEALEIHKNNNDQLGISTCLNNIGLVYFKNKEYEKSLELFQESLDIAEENGNDESKLISYENIAAVYRELGKLDQAYEMYQHALELHFNNKNDISISLAYNHLSVIDLEKNRLKKAEFNGEKSLEFAKKSDSDASMKTAIGTLWKIYKAEKKWEKALSAFELYSEIEHKINTNELDNALLEQEIKYGFEKKEAQTALEHEKELELIEANQKVQKTITWSIVIFSLLILVFTIIIIRRLSEAKKQKKLIEVKNTENELLLGEIHHRVKNNLQVISSLLSLQERNISDKTAKAAILEGKERVQSMGLIHKLLYQENNFAGIDMNDYVQKLVEGLLDSFGLSKEEMELDIDFSKINLDVDTAVPIGLMINELVINSLKYAFEGTNKPKLIVKIEEQNKQLILQVEDNGNGEVASILTSKSFGMKLIRSLSRQVNGVLEIEKHIGLCFKISINDYKTIR